MSLFENESKPNFAPVGLFPDELYPLVLPAVVCLSLIPVADMSLALAVRIKKNKMK